ncbi:unnamed protein product [Caenorhabditis auriculariae]|uniref:Uncharacterized protein n=1 Tax=Caenorhabditis auriculariae TaxID=2777116 RepID=A0A8S1HKB1_9PELO|nr:unnamed protein product [Caenorhabditis auriculariae]
MVEPSSSFEEVEVVIVVVLVEIEKVSLLVLGLYGFADEEEVCIFVAVEVGLIMEEIRVFGDIIVDESGGFIDVVVVGGSLFVIISEEILVDVGLVLVKLSFGVEVEGVAVDDVDFVSVEVSLAVVVETVVEDEVDVDVEAEEVGVVRLKM